MLGVEGVGAGLHLFDAKPNDRARQVGPCGYQREEVLQRVAHGALETTMANGHGERRSWKRRCGGITR